MQSNDPNILAQCHFRTGPHGVSKLTFTRQRAGGGAGGDADGGVAAAEVAPYRRQRMHGSAEGGGGGERDLRIMAIKLRLITVCQFMAPISRQMGVSHLLSYLRSHQK